MTKTLTLEIQDKIAFLYLDAPQKRNALSKSLIAEFRQTLKDIQTTKAKVIILSANGSVFSAGHDLKEITEARKEDDNGRDFFEGLMADCSHLMQEIVHHPLPIIGAVEGMATAAGCQLVASCDLAIGGEKARFCTPGVNIGLFCSTPMVALSRNVSRKHAMEMLLTGDVIDAIHAKNIGLINHVVSEGKALEKSIEMATKIVQKSGRVLKIGKQAFYHQLEMPLNEAYQYASHVMVENMLEKDACEGISAFVEKRKPIWQD